MSHPANTQPRAACTSTPSYQERIDAEQNHYATCLDVHDLPPIFHYWSNRHVRPRVEALGFSTPDEMFHKYLTECCSRRQQEAPRFASIGAIWSSALK